MEEGESLGRSEGVVRLEDKGLEGDGGKQLCFFRKEEGIQYVDGKARGGREKGGYEGEGWQEKEGESWE